ncbi:LytR/AlgR family response regulator transcription factor [Enhygromyxa salina]|uniref:Transcriptional regulatory protein YehT n=1 Tax=Enhygromyxa salina TaxID=215803 RepID=A0A2S9XZQ6_9BACT|nr:LytTR family DNA-binding domain-containing protein [Enhygromyxa salina]PRP98335.1 Transcriptional regulatory protein YehT [Enhygromyxa salina]
MTQTTPTPPIRTLLVDDEPLALSSLRAVLSHDPELEVVGECTDGPAALSAIAALRPDLVFLDIEMPGMDGLEVARRIAGESPPVVVFVTAYDDFALDAFEAHALDYVLKPFTDRRLLQSLRRAKAAARSRNLEDLSGRLLEFVRAAAPPPRRHLQRVVIQEPGRARIVMADEIDWIGGAKNYAELHTARGVFLHRQSMDALEQALDPSAFVRIHRSTIVRVDRVLEVIAEAGGRRLAVLRDRTRLKVSRTYVERLMTALVGS